MAKYIVSLTTEGRRDKRIGELRQTLQATPDVVIVEGGRNAYTVLASDSALEALRAQLGFAEIEPHGTLKLLSSS